MTSIAITPASGSVIHITSACRIDVDAAPDLDASTYDVDDVPTEVSFVYKLVATLAGQRDLVSSTFTPNSEGKWTWDNLIFPAAGTWAVNLINTADDLSDASLSVVVT